MHRPFRLILRLLLAGIAGRLGADPAADIAAALAVLRNQHSYAWETTDGNPGPVMAPAEFTTPDGVVRGNVKYERTQPHVKGVKRSDGTIVITVEPARDAGTTVILRPNGAAVASTPEGWLSARDVFQKLLNAIAADGPDRSRWRTVTTALVARTPESELSDLVNEVVSFRADGDEIAGMLTPDAAGRVYGLGDSAFEVDDVSGSIAFQLSHGMIRAYTLRTDATVTLHRPVSSGEAKDTVHFLHDPTVRQEHETTTVIAYASPDPFHIPEEAIRLLDAQKTTPDASH